MNAWTRAVKMYDLLHWGNNNFGIIFEKGEQIRATFQEIPA